METNYTFDVLSIKGFEINIKFKAEGEPIIEDCEEGNEEF